MRVERPSDFTKENYEKRKVLTSKGERCHWDSEWEVQGGKSNAFYSEIKEICKDLPGTYQQFYKNDKNLFLSMNVYAYVSSTQ
jgi:hypothetical protein